MSQSNQSPAPVDVLAYHDALIASHKGLSADAYHAQELPKAEAAREAIAELIAAHRDLLSRAYSMSYQVYTTPPEKNDIFDRSRAALARAGGAQ